MTEVLFYHLEQRPLEAVLPVLLEKSIERGWKVVIEVGDAERAVALDTALWTYRDDSFLPHAMAGGPLDAEQPILIALNGDNANGANVRFFVERAVPGDIAGYERVVFIFSGHDPDALADARQAWRALREGNAVTYWQQEADGRWVKKA